MPYNKHRIKAEDNGIHDPVTSGYAKPKPEITQRTNSKTQFTIMDDCDLICVLTFKYSAVVISNTISTKFISWPDYG